MNEINNRPERYYGLNRDEMLKYIPDSVSTILDVGCGEGVFGALCKERRKTEVWGVELVKEIAATASKKLDKTLVGNIEFDNIELPDRYFDCIVFNDSLEHLQYPWIVLEKIKKHLKPGGCVLASIPNIRYYEIVKKFLFLNEWEYENCGVMDKTHFRFFTIKSIRKMFEKCGYQIELLEGIKYIQFPWKFDLLNKILKNKLDDMRYKQFACLARFKG